MQYVPSLLPITGLSQSLTPHPSEALSLFLIVHSLSCIFFFLKILFVHFCKKGIDRANVVGGRAEGDTISLLSRDLLVGLDPMALGS